MPSYGSLGELSEAHLKLLPDRPRLRHDRGFFAVQAGLRGRCGLGGLDQFAEGDVGEGFVDFVEPGKQQQLEMAVLSYGFYGLDQFDEGGGASGDHVDSSVWLAR
jgi:hypothetical protein